MNSQQYPWESGDVFCVGQNVFFFFFFFFDCQMIYKSNCCSALLFVFFMCPGAVSPASLWFQVKGPPAFPQSCWSLCLFRKPLCLPADLLHLCTVTSKHIVHLSPPTMKFGMFSTFISIFQASLFCSFFSPLYLCAAIEADIIFFFSNLGLNEVCCLLRDVFVSLVVLSGPRC